MSVYPERSKCGHEKYWAGNCGTCMACLAEKAEQGLSAALVKLAEAEKTVKSFRELPKTVETEIAKCGHNRYWTTHFGACMCCQLEAAESRLKLCDDGTPDARGKFRVIEAEARAKNAEAKLAALEKVAAMARIVCAELENPNPDQHYEDEAKLTHALDELDAAQEKKS